MPFGRMSRGDGVVTETTDHIHELHKLEYQHLSSQVDDVKERVGRLEGYLNRGILLLVANLAGVATTLAHALIQS